MKQIGTRLTDLIFEHLQKEANYAGTNVSELVRKIISEHYENKERDSTIKIEFEQLAKNQIALNAAIDAINKNQIAIHNNAQYFAKQVRDALKLPHPAPAPAAQNKTP